MLPAGLLELAAGISWQLPNGLVVLRGVECALGVLHAAPRRNLPLLASLAPPVPPGGSGPGLSRSGCGTLRLLLHVSGSLYNLLPYGRRRRSRDRETGVAVVLVMGEFGRHAVVARSRRELTPGGIVNEGFPLG